MRNHCCAVLESDQMVTPFWSIPNARQTFTASRAPCSIAMSSNFGIVLLTLMGAMLLLAFTKFVYTGRLSL